MRIARLRVYGFRNIKEADITFGQNTVLIGPNNVGKTTVIEALALVLGREGMVRSLTEHDFFGSIPAAADRIKIVATIVGFSADKVEALPDWFSAGRGVPKWFNPKTAVESATPQGAPFELACNIAFQARFDHELLEVETRRYFLDDASPEDVFVDDITTPVPLHLVRDIGMFLIPASRSWDRMISFGSELFRRVVSSSGGLPAQTVLAQRDALRAPESALDQDERLKPVIDEVNKEIVDLFGTGHDIKLRITATDSTSVLDAVTPHFTSPAGTLVPSRRQGSGLISLQSLFLLLHFGTRRIAEGKGFCLAIEEPELHLPPAVQRRVLRRLRSLSSQVIVSTHSPLIAGFTEPTELLVLANNGGVLKALPLMKAPLSQATPNAIRSLVQLRRVELATAVMADTVLVPEGVLDFYWLSLLARLVELQPDTAPNDASFASMVGIVPTHDSSVLETSNLVHSAHSKVAALVDGDPAGFGYATSLHTGGIDPVLRWPDGWTIEDVLGWIIAPKGTEIIAKLAAEFAPAPISVADLVARLKDDNKANPNHLKGDRVAYEFVVRCIGDEPDCIARVTELITALSSAARGLQTTRFVKASGNDRHEMVFQP